MSQPASPSLPPGAAPVRKKPSALASCILLFLILGVLGAIAGGGFFAFKKFLPDYYKKAEDFIASKTGSTPAPAPPPEVKKETPVPSPVPEPEKVKEPLITKNDPLTAPVQPETEPVETVKSPETSASPEKPLGERMKDMFKGFGREQPEKEPAPEVEVAKEEPVPTPESEPEPEPEVPATVNADPVVTPEPVQSFAYNAPEVAALKTDADRRIDEAPADLYSDADKQRVREAIRESKNLTRVATLQFGTGGMTLGANEKARFKKALLSPEAENLMSDPQAVFFIIGYADSTGASEINRRLSQKRAASVDETLKSFKVPNKSYAVGIGSTSLISAKTQGKNRAVEVWIVLP